MAYAGGEKGLFAPYGQERGWELKIALMRAAIAGIDAIRLACPEARIVNVDPLCRVATPAGRPDLAEEARDFNERLVFQGWDMLSGRLMPELGGSREHLDIVGINYYWTNQWEWRIPLVDGRIPPLADDDPRRLPLSALVRSVWERYGGEIMITETSHVGDMRGAWLREVAAECGDASAARACRCAASASIRSSACRNGTIRTSGRRWVCGTRSATATPAATASCASRWPKRCARRAISTRCRRGSWRTAPASARSPPSEPPATSPDVIDVPQRATI